MSAILYERIAVFLLFPSRVQPNVKSNANQSDRYKPNLYKCNERDICVSYRYPASLSCQMENTDAAREAVSSLEFL